MVLWDAEHRGDDLDRERRSELLDHVEFVTVDGAEVFVDDSSDHRSAQLDCARGEKFVQHASHLPMFRRIHELQQPDFRRRSACLHHGEVHTVCGGVRFVVLVCRGHILVAGQRVEVVLVAVVDRRLAPHPSVELVRVVEELLRERVEYQGCFPHVRTVRPRSTKDRQKPPKRRCFGGLAYCCQLVSDSGGRNLSPYLAASSLALATKASLPVPAGPW